jgi:Cu2+-exporting ATPase
VSAAREQGLVIAPVTGSQETAGFGLERATTLGRERLGSPAWCGRQNLNEGVALCYRAVDGTITDFILADQLRQDASGTIQALARAGLAVEILSGDRPGVVAAVARDLGVHDFAGQLLPTDKIARLAALAAAGRKVLMVGDGLNDAPALGSAHASLSPATAADISQTAADAVFQGEALAPVLETLCVARAARRMALENFAIAIGYNLVFVPLAVAGHVTPLLAAIAMSFSSLAVTANALRLRSQRLPSKKVSLP